MTGEVLHNGRPFRHDPASAMWQEGGDSGGMEWGTKFVFTAVAGPGHLDKVNLGMTKQYKGGSSEVDEALATSGSSSPAPSRPPATPTRSRQARSTPPASRRNARTRSPASTCPRAATAGTSSNRSEHLRQRPPDTQAYARTYGRRPPAESDNSQRERRYVFQRIPAYGPEQQSLVMLLGSLLDNSKSRWIHQRRQQAEQQAA